MAEKTIALLPPVSSNPAQNTTVQVNLPDGFSNSLILGPTSKEIMMGAGALLLLAVVFFFIRMTFVGYLVGPSMKRSPNSAGLAGWGLFGGLFFGSAIGCVAMVSKIYMTLPVIIPLSLLSLICFVIALVVSLRK